VTHAARERLQISAPMLFVSAAAWILLFIPWSGTRFCHAEMSGAASGRQLIGLVIPLGFSNFLAAQWGLMLVAMMLPILIAPVRHIRDRSFAHRRLRAIALFLAGYAAIWMLAGAGLLTLAAVARLRTSPSMGLMIATAAAVLYEFSPAKQSCLNRCHEGGELNAFGFAADWSALRFGLIHGKWCVGSCWVLMLLPWLVVQGHALAMAGVTLWLFAERLDPPTHPRWRWRVPVKAFRIALAQARSLHLSSRLQLSFERENIHRSGGHPAMKGTL
jgi:predicted metal-binding membrane protein